MKISAHGLKALYCTLTQERSISYKRPSLKKISVSGWVSMTQAFDVLSSMDGRMLEWGIVPEWLLETIGIRTSQICQKPKARQNYAVSVAGMTFMDFTGLAIQLKHLGLDIDADELVSLAMPMIAGKRWLTKSELWVHWYGDERDKKETIVIADEVPVSKLSDERFKSFDGYMIHTVFAGDSPKSMTITGPRFRQERDCGGRT